MAKYLDAIDWIVEVDDTAWLERPDGIPSVTASLVAYLFDKPLETVREDLRVAHVKRYARIVRELGYKQHGSDHRG